MERTLAVSEHVRLMGEYVISAELNLAHRNLVPAHNHALHALELGLKAALLADGGDAERTHNPGGAFGRRYRHRVDPPTLRRIRKALHGYNAPRYPGLGPPEEDEVENEIRFILAFLESELLGILDEAMGAHVSDPG